mgnify:CR=1 FL=1|tara:strand:+ start:771 stop:977 length:207 start_codon:yes stop_codon:yes gene_type:complete
MKTVIASGYIKKSKDITHKESITNRFAGYEGELKIDKKKVLVQVYSDNENFKNKEVFVRLSVDTGLNL